MTQSSCPVASLAPHAVEAGVSTFSTAVETVLFGTLHRTEKHITSESFQQSPTYRVIREKVSERNEMLVIC